MNQSTVLACTPWSLGEDRDGIALMLQLGNDRFLLDCGPNPVLTSLTPPNDGTTLDPALRQQFWELKGLICSHAHPEQIQAIPSLLHHCPHLPLYSSRPTADLLPTLLDHPPNLNLKPLPWRSPHAITPHVTLELWPAGHLLGASLCLLSYSPQGSQSTQTRPYTVLYTGDCSLAHSRLSEGLPLQDLRGLRPDVLIVDAYGGTARSGRRRLQELELLKGLEEALAQGRSVVLPLPPLGRAQEILALLKTHHPFQAQPLTLWVDPWIAAGCDAYGRYLEELPTPIQNLTRHQPIFWEQDRSPLVRPLPGDPLNWPPDHQPSIFLVAEDQAWVSWLGRLRNPVVLKGIDPGMAGTIAPDPIPQSTYIWWDHCDGMATCQLIHNLRPQHVLFVRGQRQGWADLAALEELNSRYHLHLPKVGKTTEFPVGDQFFQPPTPETLYEAEIHEQDLSAQLQIPPQLLQDPRWYRLVDTGIVHLRWQGDELVIRGLSGRELVNRDSQQRDYSPPAEAQLEVTVRNCSTCRHYRGQRCWNEASPLQGYRVTPEGYCPSHSL